MPPEEDERTAWWLGVFGLLNHSRQSGCGAPQPIALAEMAALLSMISLPCSNEEFIGVIQEMDVAFLEHANKRKGKK